MKQATILQILPSLHSGGVERGTLDIAQRLVSEGYQSIVLSSGGPLVKDLEHLGSKHITLPVHTKNPFKIWYNSKIITSLIHNHKIDLMHVRSRAPAWSVYWASQSTGTPFITTFHGTYGHKSKLKRWYNSAMLRGSQTIAVSDFIAKHIKNTYPDYPCHSQVIYRGINTELFKPVFSQTEQHEIEHLKSTWNIPSNKKILLLPGRLTRIKGHHLLLEALQKVDPEKVYVLIVGDEPGKGQYKTELEKQIMNAKLSRSVKLTGHLSNMKLAYALCDIVISATTKPEAFGRVACEAQAMKKLVIASRHGGSNETISPELRSLMFTPNDASDLANSINKAINILDNDISNLATTSRTYIENNFTLDKMCRDTLKLYELELSKYKSTPKH